jgi:hypothetical protein
VKTDLLVSNGDMVPANQKSNPTSWIFNTRRNAPVNKREYKEHPELSEIFNEYNNAYYSNKLPEYSNVTHVTNESRRIPITEGAANSSNTVLYKWDPNYGYRQVMEYPPTYNHPGAFLGNTIRENGGITVNGEGVLRKPYQTPESSDWM